MERRHGTVTVDLETSLAAVDEQAWNRLVAADDPFHEYGFLHAMEASGAVGAGTGWEPRFLLARVGGSLAGALPFYLKYHSWGEYIFDWQWAEAYGRAGLDYYPKALVGLPFTPASCQRILVAPGYDFEEIAAPLVRHLLAFARSERLSSVHALFLEAREQRFLEGMGFASRLSSEFLWRNHGYSSFEDFTQALRSKKRKQIVAERRAVRAMGLEITTLVGDQIQEPHVEAMWRFYADTTERKGGQRYLNRETFGLLHQDCRHNMVMVLARDGGREAAGSLAFHKSSSLYGRYWGSLGHYPGLHFECCYYLPLDYAIEAGVGRFDAGVQGEQKFFRGFEAHATLSSHWMAHPPARRAIEDYLSDERHYVREVIARYNSLSPLKALRSRVSRGDGKRGESPDCGG
ncbi:MAG: GNAT family N-acetyltransferase [Dehalococcoidia bacterium]